MRKKLLKFSLVLALAVILLCSTAYAEDEAETQYAPDITVYLSNAETGSANADPGNKTSIKARVLYEGCAEGEEYVLVLMLKDSKTGSLCSFPDGLTSIKQSFKAEGRAGIFEFVFDFSASRYSGCSLVESHYIEGMESLTKGSGSDDTGYIYVPKIHTYAVSSSGENTVLAGKESIICDIISYTALAPGEEYRLVTGLKDAVTGEVILNEDGTPVSASSRFTPTSSDGKIATRIKADLREYGDKDIIVYEDIYILPKSGNQISLLTSDTEEEENRTVRMALTSVSVQENIHGEGVPGVELKITSGTDGHVFSGTTDENGRFYLPLDENETSLCTVVSVPEAYGEVKEGFKIDPFYSEDASALVIMLTKKTTIVLERTDAETGLPIQGIVTEVQDSSGNKLSVIVSDESGKAYFDAEGCWKEALTGSQVSGQSSAVLDLVFVDTSTPSTYYKRSEPWTISFDSDRNMTGQTELLSYTRSPITLTAIDDSGNGIQGAVISVLSEDGTVEGKAMTDHEGKIYFTPSTTGNYIIIEDAVPINYVIAAGKNTITVSEIGEVEGTLTLINLSDDYISQLVTTLVIKVALFLGVWIAATRYVKKRRPGRGYSRH